MSDVQAGQLRPAGPVWAHLDKLDFARDLTRV